LSGDGHRIKGEGLEDAAAPAGAKPDPDHTGWYSWGDFPRGSFAAATGRLLFRPAGPKRGECRMFPTEAHQNMGGSIHGGAVMSFIDMALFAGGRCAGMAEGHYVTLDCATHFIARGRIDVSSGGWPVQPTTSRSHLAGTRQTLARRANRSGIRDLRQRRERSSN